MLRPDSVPICSIVYALAGLSDSRRYVNELRIFRFSLKHLSAKPKLSEKERGTGK
jgi:hypothetical protein